MGLTRKGVFSIPKGFPTIFPKGKVSPRGIELHNVAFGRSRAPGFLLPGPLKFHREKFAPEDPLKF